MNGSRVPQIMQSRLVASAVAPKDSRVISQATESDLSRVACKRRAISDDEQWGIWIVTIVGSPQLDVLFQDGPQIGANRHPSRLVELALANE
jgi:hypothetical protein